MNEVKFYRDDRGREPVAEFIKDLVDRTDKDGRINLKKLDDCSQALDTNRSEIVRKGIDMVHDSLNKK